MPFANKQFERTYDADKVKLTTSKRPKWYVEFVGYYATDVQFISRVSTAPYWVKANSDIAQGFSAYGFFDNFQYCSEKTLPSVMNDKDGIKITFRRSEQTTKWVILRVDLLRFEDYPEHIKAAQVR
jgi:hypothetical protein